MTFAHPFQQMVKIVQQNDVFKIKQAASGSKNSEHCDRFFVSLTLANVPVEWFVLLDQQNTSEAPDFIFCSSPDFCPTPCNFYWDPRDPNSLNKILEDLRTKFRAYHMDSVKKLGNTTITFEVESLVQIGGMELYYSQEQSQIFISIPLTLCQEEQHNFNTNIKDLPILNLILNTKQPNVRSTQIILPLNWNSNYPKLSEFPKFDVDVTVEYLTKLETFWADKLQSRKYNEKIINLFYEVFRSGVVETSSSSISFICNWSDNFTLVKIELPTNFPNQAPPCLTFMPLSGDKKSIKKIDDIPWSPRWKLDEILIKIKLLIQKHLDPKEGKNPISNLLGLTNLQGW